MDFNATKTNALLNNNEKSTLVEEFATLIIHGKGVSFFRKHAYVGLPKFRPNMAHGGELSLH